MNAAERMCVAHVAAAAALAQTKVFARTEMNKQEDKITQVTIGS